MLLSLFIIPQARRADHVLLQVVWSVCQSGGYNSGHSRRDESSRLLAPFSLVMSNVSLSSRGEWAFPVAFEGNLANHLVYLVSRSILFGYDLGVIANVIIAPDFLRITKLDGGKPSDADYVGFIVSSFLLG